MSSWKLIKSPKLTGSQNMEIDLKLFQDFEKGLIPPTLRFYSWKPNCISFGYSQKIEKLIKSWRAQELGWDIVKRPTGGGMVFHNEAEITYSLVMAIDDPRLPRGLVPSYLRISQAIVRGLSLLGIKSQILNPKFEIRNQSKILNSKFETDLCFNYPVEYEIVYGGKKLVGSAQKRGKRALLQQGSIFVRNDFNGVFSVLKEPVDREWYTSKAISAEEILGREISFGEVAEALVEGFSRELEIKFKD